MRSTGFIVSILLVCLLVGCGQQASSTSSSSPPDQQPGTVEDVSTATSGEVGSATQSWKAVRNELLDTAKKTAFSDDDLKKAIQTFGDTIEEARSAEEYEDLSQDYITASALLLAQSATSQKEWEIGNWALLGIGALYVGDLSTFADYTGKAALAYADLTGDRSVLPPQEYANLETQANKSTDDGESTDHSSSLTAEQQNAVAAAKSYLSVSAFSRQGLIEQLEFSEYTHDDAVLAVENLKISWEEQALKKAKAYLSVHAFSYSGMIEQLEFDGFTKEEATYGADYCKADWSEQAAKCAANYLSIMPFSRQGLIDQLKYEGFTQKEADYGVTKAGLK